MQDHFATSKYSIIVTKLKYLGKIQREDNKLILNEESDNTDFDNYLYLNKCKLLWMIKFTKTYVLQLKLISIKSV